MSQVHLPLGALLRENMAEAHLLVDHLARSRHLVALGRRLSCFHLRHFLTYLFLAPQGTRTPEAALYSLHTEIISFCLGR